MTARKSVRAVDVEARSSTNYPGALAERVRGRTKRALGNRFGLDQFGVNLTELAPGAHSALRHWHSAEDEFVYVLSGEVALVTGSGEENPAAGDCVGFKAGNPDGHCLVNRSDAPATYLEMGSRRIGEDRVVYPDEDLMVVPDGTGKRRFVRKDATPI